MATLLGAGTDHRLPTWTDGRCLDAFALSGRHQVAGPKEPGCCDLLSFLVR